MSFQDHNRDIAYKVLVIFFIILTISLHLGLLLRFLRVPKVLDIPAHTIKISLSLGCILLALFPYVVYAIHFFESEHALTCRTWITAGVYMESFFPFVFGCGLCLVGLSTLTAKFRLPVNNAKILSLIYTATPWLAGLLLVCPLTMAGTDWYRCVIANMTIDRQKAIVVICKILPASLALVLSVVVVVLHKQQLRQQQGGVGLTMNQPSQQHPSFNSPQNHHANSPHNPMMTTPQPNQQYPLTTPQPNEQYHCTYPQQESQCQPLYDVAKELRILVRTSILFFFTIIPIACYELYTMDQRRTNQVRIVLDIFYWVMYLYPAITPVFWHVLLNR